MKTTRSIIRYALLATLPLLAACKGIGFRHMEGASEKATVQSANETLQQIEVALERYHEVNHRYPQATDLSLYDSLRDYFLIPVDAANLYRNENDQATYVAVGGRKNKIIYHYPATLGSGEYTLYWIGLNAVDEEGRGDDIFATPTSAQKQLSRRVFVDFRNDSAKVEFVLSATGGDARKDEAVFVIRSGKTTIYEDRWAMSAYTRNRPDLSERERQEVMNAEFDRFLRPTHFNSVDSLAKNPGSLLTRRIDSKDFSDLAKAKLPVFTYYSAGEGAKAVYWSVKAKKVVVIELGS
ncbi:MAG: hypothetical protein JSS75_01450 [Bacteroidetes bacterium]|nr:hypothetical protein [Bacteroidota bacterium]